MLPSEFVFRTWRRAPAALLALAACDSADGDEVTDGLARDCAPSLVVDVDETLTTLDSEWIAQIVNGAHDPAMRPAADALMNAWVDAGYRVLYVTARGETSTLSDGRTAREATSDWLDAHDFPRSADDLYLSDGFGAVGEQAHAYKTEVLTTLSESHDLLAAYGNAESDIQACQDVAIPTIWLVGELAGTMGVDGIPDEDAYEAHLAALEIPEPCPATGSEAGGRAR